MVRISLVVAMQAEAKPLIEALALTPSESPDPALPMRFYRGTHSGLDLRLSTAGQDPQHQVDLIGTQPAALHSYLALRAHSPALCINLGTAGGFARRGARIGDVFVSDGPVRFHDRRIPLGPFEAYGVGAYPSLPLGSWASELGLRPGRISTSDSLDATDACHARMEQFEADAKEMEAASIAWVCATLGVPFVGLKAITDLVDAHEATAAQFERNLAKASAALRDRALALLELLGREPARFGL